VIEAFARQGTVDGIEQAERILDTMERDFIKRQGFGKLTNYPYNIMMHAYAQTGNSSKAEHMFEHLTDVGRQMRLPHLRPDVISCSMLMNAWTNECKPGFVAKIEQLLSDMEASADKGMQPDVITYGIVLNALARSDDRDVEARQETVLRNMRKRGIEPNRVCFNCVMKTYAARGNFRRAREMLLNMDRKESTSAADFSLCIMAYAKSRHCFNEDHLRDAVRLFSIVIDRYKEGNAAFKSNGSMVRSMAYVLIKCNFQRKADVARDIMAMAQESKIDIDTSTYNAIIKACSTETGDTEAKLDALEYAGATFQMMRHTQAGVDDATYWQLLHCLINLMDNIDERNAAIKKFFSECCQEGMVSSGILSVVHRYVPDYHIFSDLVQDEDGVVFDCIPSEWKRAIGTKVARE
jgi:pentatricopeptide repeat protein